MNGKLARELRRQAFGDFSIRNSRYTRAPDLSIRCAGRRTHYQQLKKDRRPKGCESNPMRKRRIPKWLTPRKKGQ